MCINSYEWLILASTGWSVGNESSFMGLAQKSIPVLKKEE